MQTLNSEETSVIATLACVQNALASVPGRRVWCKSRDGIYLWATDNFAEDACRTIPELIGETTAEVWPDDWRECERIDALVMATRRSYYDHAETLAPPSGGTLSVAVSRSPMVDEAGEVCGVVGYYDCGQSAAHREAEEQLILALVPLDCRERIAAGLAVLREEFTS